MFWLVFFVPVAAAEERLSDDLDAIIQRFADLEMPVIEGEYQLVYEPDPQKPHHWFVNDHCLIRDDEGRIHYFGIENPYPTTEQALEWRWVSKQLEEKERPFVRTLYRMMGGHLYNRHTHYRVGHAVADSIWGPWTRHEAALHGGEEKKHFGSPYVVKHGGKYWMLLPSATGLAVSDDLMKWKVAKSKTNWEKMGKGHRDPCVIKMADGTYLQYYAACEDTKKHQVLHVARSKDLLEWERLEPCYQRDISEKGHWCSLYESPYVLERKGLYYLFVCYAHRRYYETWVVVSDNPYKFEPRNTITTIMAHAPEFIEIDGQMYISSCGIEDPQGLNRSGLWIAKLRWLKPK
jgi:beta-xylosidase